MAEPMEIATLVVGSLGTLGGGGVFGKWLFEKLSKRAADADNHDRKRVDSVESVCATNTENIRDLTHAMQGLVKDHHASKERAEGYYAENSKRYQSLHDWRTELNVMLKPVFADLEARTVRFDTAEQAADARAKRRKP